MTKEEKENPIKTKLPKERVHFKQLLLANHFGTFPIGEGKPLLPALGNKTYEELMCVGYQPQFKRLDAVVHIKQANGYSGGICTAGSQEYVKFFISTDGGVTWSDKGTVSFTVWDVPGTKPLEYDATFYIDLKEACCKKENLVLVRAILSWEVPPGGPNDPVVWGNSIDATIQVEPIQHGSLAELLNCFEVPLPIDKLPPLLDVNQTVKFATPKQLTLKELHDAYQHTKVPPHRYLLAHAQELLAKPASLTEKLTTPGFQVFPGLKNIDLSKLIAIWIDPQGDQTYEQIGCVGLNPYTNELVATIDVKLSSGYSGNLCSQGSYEYVAFWVDWQDGSGWHYINTGVDLVMTANIII
jgi:hypothetical protein